MPARTVKGGNAHSTAVRQIIASSTDGDFLAHLVDGMRSSRYADLYSALDRISADRDVDIEHMCTSNHGEFVSSVNKLDKARADCTSLGTEIVNLVQSYSSSTENLATQKKNLVDSRSVRQNIDESSEALKECLEVLRLANQVHDLVAKQNHYAALRALDELEALLRARESCRYYIGDLIEKSIPTTQKMIAEAVMSDLNTWLYQIRDVSQYIGEVAFFHTEQRRTRQKERAAADPDLAPFKLNSAVELVADEVEEYDVLNDEDAQIQVDFTPLFDAIHIHEALGQNDRFRSEYAMTRRRQKDLILPMTLKINDEEASELKTLLESITGFAIVERATMKQTEGLRSSIDVDELWDSMSQSAISLMTGAVQAVDDADLLLRITGVISMFIQTLETFEFVAPGLNNFLMTLFERYVQLLKKSCTEDFQEIVATDDYMPMPVASLEEYDKIVDVVWYTPDQTREEVIFPCVLPFSQMYPMCCIDIRNFLSQVYTAPDDYVSHSSRIDETIRNSLDGLLCENICQPLMDRLSSQYPGQIVQILTNLEHFERACEEMQVELASARTSRSRAGPIILKATGVFRDGRERAKARIFELVNSKIADQIETAEYDWLSQTTPTEPSNYMMELTRWLSNIMNSVLLGLPVEIKDEIYLDSLNHAAARILDLPLEQNITAISPPALRRLSLDIQHLSAFVSTLSLSTTKSSSFSLRRTMDGLSQTVALMCSDDPNEFFDISQRSRKYGAVDAQNGAMLLDKVEQGKELMAKQGQAAGAATEKVSASDRFGSVMRGLRARGGTESGGQ